MFDILERRSNGWFVLCMAVFVLGQDEGVDAIVEDGGAVVNLEEW